MTKNTYTSNAHYLLLLNSAINIASLGNSQSPSLHHILLTHGPQSL